MIELVFLAQLILGQIEPNIPCESAKRSECIDHMQRVFRTTHPETGTAYRSIDGSRYTAIPVDLLSFGEKRALVVMFESAAEMPTHAEYGRFSAYYFDDPASSRPTRAFRDFTGSGRFGQAGSVATLMLDGVTPALVVEGAGTWQGHTCGWVSIAIFDENLPQKLISFLSYAQEPYRGRNKQTTGTLIGPLSRHEIELKYTINRPSTSGRTIRSEASVIYRLEGETMRRIRGPDLQAC